MRWDFFCKKKVGVLCRLFYTTFFYMNELLIKCRWGVKLYFFTRCHGRLLCWLWNRSHSGNQGFKCVTSLWLWQPSNDIFVPGFRVKFWEPHTSKNCSDSLLLPYWLGHEKQLLSLLLCIYWNITAIHARFWKSEVSRNRMGSASDTLWTWKDVEYYIYCYQAESTDKVETADKLSIYKKEDGSREANWKQNSWCFPKVFSSGARSQGGDGIWRVVWAVCGAQSFLLSEITKQQAFIPKNYVRMGMGTP